jgi:hypothetical protein
MSILDLHGDDMLAAASKYVRPMLPEPKFNAAALVTAVPRGATEAVFQVSASVSELAQAPKRRTELESADGAMTNEFSDVFRQAGRDLRPDAQSAHAAEQLLYQFARGATKIVGGFVAGGPVGVIAMGAEEANSQADDLRREGVDLRTRATAGAVQGAGLALAAIPAAGATLKTTAGLYLAGGPGGYVAQQALTREVLQRGGYEKLGEQYDPLDPLGLAVASLVPLPFAAIGMRNARATQAAADAERVRTAPMPSEPTAVAAAARETMAPKVVDAARVAYAVERRAASNPGRGLRSEDAHEQAMARAEEAVTRGGAVQVADLVPVREIEGLEAFVKRSGIRAEPIPPEVRGDFLSWLRGVGGIDLGQKLDISGDRNNVRNNPGGIFRAGGQPTDILGTLAEEAGYLRPGQGDSYAFVELVQEALRGNRVLTLTEQAEASARTQAAESLAARLEAAETRLKLLGVDPAPAKGNVPAMEAYLRQREPDLLAAALFEARRAADQAPELDDLMQRARQMADDIIDSDRTIEQWEAEVAPMSVVMRRMVSNILAEQQSTRAPITPQAQNPEAAAPARGVGEAAAAPTVPQPGSAPAPEAAGLTSRLAQVEAEFPGLMVRMDGDEAARPLAEFLAAARAEADEIAADAPLVQALAECALLNGST